jgi:predicted lipoprotein with Yx(FWY)xxD motif
MIRVIRERLLVLAATAAVAAMLLSACTAGAGAASATAPSMAGGGAPSPGGGASQVATSSVPGIGAVLVNGQGLTLYHLTTDTSTETTCTAGCAQLWPPLLSTGGTAPSAAGVKGSFATLDRPDGGVQVTFDGMPLYTYAGDQQPGQANGQGIGGTWFAVTS